MKTTGSAVLVLEREEEDINISPVNIQILKFRKKEKAFLLIAVNSDTKWKDEIETERRQECVKRSMYQDTPPIRPSLKCS